MKTMLVIALTTIIVVAGFPTEKFKQILGNPKIAGPPEDACKLKSILTIKAGVTVDQSNCNKTFTVAELNQKPLVEWKDAYPDVGYTFLLIGSNPRVFWAVGNIPGSTLKGVGNITGFDELSSYQELHKTNSLHNYPKGYLLQALIYGQKKGTLDVTKAKISYVAKQDLDVGKYVQRNGLFGPEAGVQFWISEDPVTK